MTLNGASHSRNGRLVWQFITILGWQSAFIVTPLLIVFAATILGTFSTYKVMHNTNLATQNRVKQSTRRLVNSQSRLAPEPELPHAALKDALPAAGPTSHADGPVKLDQPPATSPAPTPAAVTTAGKYRKRRRTHCSRRPQDLPPTATDSHTGN